MNIRPTLIQLISCPFFCALLFLFLFSCGSCGGTEKKTEVVNIRLEGAPNNLNPFLTSSAYSLYVCNQMFQTLGNLDPKTLEMKPLLAKSIPTVRNVTDGPFKGSLAYDFEIQEEAKWDNGTPVTAQDVIFSMKLMFHPGLPTQNWASYYQSLQNVEVDPGNPKKFTAYFKEYYMLALESMCQFFVYPAYNYDPNNRLTNIPLTRFLDKSKSAELTADINVKIFADEFSQPKFAFEPAAVTGSGPYRLESINDQSAVLVKKADWWGNEATAGTPLLATYPEKLVYKVVKDEPLVETMLRNEELDIVTGLDATRFVQLKSDASLKAKYDFITNGSIQYARWMFNLRNPKLADVRVRRALAQVVDYNYALTTLLQGLAQPIVGPVNPVKSYYAGNIQSYTMNMAAARQLLAEAGWADSNNDGIVDKMINNQRTELTIDVLVPVSSKINSALAASLNETALQAGVKINVVGTDINKITSDTRNGQFESAFMGAQLFPGLVELYARFHSASLIPAGDNRSGFANVKADSLIVAIRTTPDEAVRKALYLQVQQILHDELPEVPLFAPLQRIIVANRFDYVLTANRPGYYEQMFKLK